MDTPAPVDEMQSADEPLEEEEEGQTQFDDTEQEQDPNLEQSNVDSDGGAEQGQC